MKYFRLLMAIAFLVISICMGYLVWSGIAVRTEPITKPAFIKDNGRNISAPVVLRLSPELREAQFVLMGFSPLNETSSQLFLGLVDEAEKLLNQKIQVLDGVHSTPEEIENCSRPCWVLVPAEMASEMTKNDWLERNFLNRTEKWISLTLLRFARPLPGLSERCEKQKQLSFDCLTEVSTNEVSRKLKSEGEKYFFMRNYLGKNYLLFVEAMD